MRRSFCVIGVVLAAGSSSRLGRPKQLVELGGKALVVRAVEQLRSAGCSSVMTVLGSDADQVRSKLKDVSTEIVVNNGWESGMASSIRIAVDHLPKTADALLLALCDQPLIEHSHYRNLMKSISGNECSMVATRYPNGESGVPAAFSRLHFDSLSQLDGDVGAKQIILANTPKLCPIKGQPMDLDTNDDLAALQKMTFES